MQTTHTTDRCGVTAGTPHWCLYDVSLDAHSTMGSAERKNEGFWLRLFEVIRTGGYCLIGRRRFGGD